MAEADFQGRQATTATRSLTTRARDAALLGILLSAVYAAILWGINVQGPRGFLAFLVAAGLVVWGGLRVRPVRERLGRLVAVNAPVVNGYMVLGALLFPLVSRQNEYLIHVVTVAGIYALMALGLNMTLGFAGLVDLGYAAYFAAGAYTSAQLAVILGMPFWIGLALGGLVAAGFGFCIAWPCLRVQEKYLALVTLGFGLMVELLARNLRVLTNGTDGIAGIPPPSLGAVDFLSPLALGGLRLPFQANYYYLVLALVALVMLVSHNLQRSRPGRSWEAIREDETAAGCFGVNLISYKLLAFCSGAFMAGMAGAVFAHMIGFVHPDNFNFQISMGVLVMVVAGGMGNTKGVLLGALFFVVVPERLREFESLRLMLFGASLLLLMLFRPEGIFPAGRRRIGLDTERLEQLARTWTAERTVPPPAARSAEPVSLPPP